MRDQDSKRSPRSFGQGQLLDLFFVSTAAPFVEICRLLVGPIHDGFDIPFFGIEDSQKTRTSTGSRLGHGPTGLIRAALTLFFRAIPQIFIRNEGVDLVGRFKKFFCRLDFDLDSLLGLCPIFPNLKNF